MNIATLIAEAYQLLFVAPAGPATDKRLNDVLALLRDEIDAGDK